MPGRARDAVAALLGGEAINKSARFAASVVLARSLTVEEFGLVNIGIALSGILAIAASLGLSDYGARTAATDPGRIPRVVRPILLARLGALTGLTLLGIGVALIVTPDSVELVALAASMSLGVVVSLDWLLRGRSRMREVALAASGGGILLLVLCLTVVVQSPSVPVALGAFIAAELAAAAITWAATRVKPAPLRHADAVRPILSSAWPLAVSAIVVYAYTANLDTILLGALRSDVEAGLYSAPYRVFLGGTAIAIFAGYAYLPRVAATHRATEESTVTASFQRALIALCGYGVLVTGLTEIIGEEVLGVLFGEDFRSMRATFVILVVSLPWYAIGFPAGYTLIARGEERRFMTGAGLAGGLNLTLGLALIPLSGPEGAAIATTVALIVGSMAWLRAQSLVGALSLPLAVASCVTAGAALVALDAELGVVIGAVTVAGGGSLLLRAHRWDKARVGG